MESVVTDIRGLVDQLNPLSRQNQILYLFWLAGYFFLMAGIWRCDRRSVRFCFLIIHQLFSAGVFISQINIVVLAIVLWAQSLAVIVVAVVLAMVIFRRRKPTHPPDPQQPAINPTPANPAVIENQAAQLTTDWRERQDQHSAPRKGQP